MIRAISFLLTFFMSFLSAQAILPQPTGTMASRAASAAASRAPAATSPSGAAPSRLRVAQERPVSVTAQARSLR